MNFYKDKNDKVYGFNDLQVANGEVLDNLMSITKEAAHNICHPPEHAHDARSRVSHDIRRECENRIDAGFTADILFPNSNYGNDRDQQRTIEKAANKASGGYIYMNEDFTHHSQAQAQSILILSDANVESCRLKNAAKQEYLQNQDLTLEQITAVTWESVE